MQLNTEMTEPPLYYLDTCIISTIIKDRDTLSDFHRRNMEAMGKLIRRCEPDDFVMSPQALAEFQRDRNDYRRELKADIYHWMDKVSTSSNNLLLIPVHSNTGRGAPMLPIPDPYNPLRPPGSPPFKLPEGVVAPKIRLIGFDILFSDKGLLKELRDIFDRADAEHVYQAVEGGCRYFVTLDQKTIIDRIPAHEERVNNLCHGMRFLNPVKLLKIVSTERV